MSDRLDAKKDYPLYRQHPDLIKAKSGKSINDITLENVISGDVKTEDLRISAGTLEYQAQIQESFGNPQVAENFRRAAELIEVPDEKIIEIYNAMRPNGATKAQLMALADELEEKYGALRNAALVRETAEVHDKRGVLAKS